MLALPDDQVQAVQRRRYMLEIALALLFLFALVLCCQGNPMGGW